MSIDASQSSQQLKKSTMNLIKTIAALAIAAASIGASARTATITLDGDWYLQAGTVTSSMDLVRVTYSTGPQLDGRAVFQGWMAGGIQEAPFGADRYSVQSWDLSGQSFTFSGLDIDIIDSGTIGGIDEITIDPTGSSLAGAYVELTWADGFYKRLSLNTTPWDQTQILTWTDVAPVPEPAALLMMLAGLGVLGFVARKTGGAA